MLMKDFNNLWPAPFYALYLADALEMQEYPEELDLNPESLGQSPGRRYAH